MTKYVEKVLTVPNNIDYDKIWSKIQIYAGDANDKGRNKIKDSIYLFLHYIYPSSNYMTYTKDNGFYKKILSKEFNSVTRNLLTTTVKILTDPDYPVIETRNYKVGSYAKSYKLKNDFFLFCRNKNVKIQSLISQNYHNRIIKYNKEKFDEIKNETCETGIDWEYLFSQYEKDIITIDNRVDDYINAIELELLKRLSKKTAKPYYQSLEKNIKDKILSMRRSVIQIKNGEFEPTFQKRNNRLYSVLTSCKREIRKFIKINNNKVSEIDISNSHLYILSNILHQSFYLNKNKLSLFNIDINLYNKINKNFNRTRYYLQLIKKFEFNHQLLNEHKSSYIPYMCGTFLNKEDIGGFRSLPFNNNIYDHLNELIFNGEKDRDFIKRNVMSYMNLKRHRENNTFIRKMKERFPSVNGIIEMINELDESRGWMSILLQRFESYLLLDVGIRKLLQEMPDLNFFTVHDSIVVEETKAIEVRNSLAEIIRETTGTPIGLVIKPATNPFDRIDQTINEIWNKSFKKVVNKRRKEKYKKM